MGGGETGTGGAPPKHPEGLGVPAALPRLLVHGAAVLVPDGAPGGGEGSAKDPLPAPKTRARLQPALTSGCSWWGRAGKRRPRRGISRWARRRRPPSPRWGSAARTAARPCSGRKPRTDPPPGGHGGHRGGSGTSAPGLSSCPRCPRVPTSPSSPIRSRSRCRSGAGTRGGTAGTACRWCAPGWRCGVTAARMQEQGGGVINAE